MAEWYHALRQRWQAQRHGLPGCNNLAKTIDALGTMMKIPAIRLSPLNPLKSLALLLEAHLHGTRANITNVFRI
jgi:hypothetical protein